MEPDVQARILEAMEPEKAADIIEEMAPDQAAHVLAELAKETSSEILEEMDAEQRTDVSEIIEYEEDTAGYLMNTEFIAVGHEATVADALQALRANEELLETLNTIFLVDPGEKLFASVPIARLFLAPDGRPLRELAHETLISVSADEKQDRVTELFDKYNVLTLPVVDEQGRLAGVITADDVISLLRSR
jgi:Mg/Co/Ni transporter MgtE